MKLSASVLATLCAVTGCESMYEVRSPAPIVETEQEPEPEPAFAPAPPAFAKPPVTTNARTLQPAPPQVTTSDPCPACGMG